MAKKRQDGRDDLSIAIGLPMPRPGVVTPVLSSPMTEYEDRRAYHPEQDFRPATLVTGGTAKLRTKDRRSKKTDDWFTPIQSLQNQTKAIIAFAESPATILCVRRATRRQVIHAKRLNGRSGQRRPRRNFFSNISCK